MDKNRYELIITGIVQGVGFRPFIYNLAESLGLNGWVNNKGGSVVIELETDKGQLELFIDRIKSQAPPLSRITGICTVQKPYIGYRGFEIRQSAESSSEGIYISPDVVTCKDCQKELFDKSNSRYLYPFINCTNCGPRFTIISGVPYDRPKTTMAKFSMCTSCMREYEDSTNRRYHAQPISCYSCGPRLMLLDRKRCEISTGNAVEYTRKMLLNGSIVAIKGLGGYHLSCNAMDERAVTALRKRKIREDKPFALMVRDVNTALKFCHMDASERKLLESEKRPIVLLKKRQDCILPESIAPENPNLGIMLPYTPLHMLLLSGHPLTLSESMEEEVSGLNHISPKDSKIVRTVFSDGCSHNTLLDAIVMTSGNRSSEPIYYKDGEAFENLSSIADYFLTNDREIYIRTDDSVTRVFNGKEYIIRRSRGYVPLPVTCKVVNSIYKSTKPSKLSLNSKNDSSMGVPSILACGGELKNTFCMNKGEEFFLSHHIGDLENVETFEAYENGIEHFKRLFDIKPQIIAHDLHPEYLSTKYAVTSDISVKIPVQHHHAHIASCMADNGLDGDVIGVAFDGTGYGEDGHIWGGEFFTGSYRHFTRAGQLEYVKLPGGDMAVKEPWRMALSYLYQLGPGALSGFEEEKGLIYDKVRILQSIPSNKIRTVLQMLDKNINSPLTSSMGRLFDGVSALLGIRDTVNFEGQAAVELELKSSHGYNGEYNFNILDNNGLFKISVSDVIKSVIIDMNNNIDRSIIAARFHETAANMVLDMCRRIHGMSRLDKVVLSGGVFQNITLLTGCKNKLEEAGFTVYVHSTVPANDGGIALGQALIAAARIN